MQVEKPVYSLLDEIHPLNTYGYQVCHHGGEKDYCDLKNTITDYLRHRISEFCQTVDDALDFSLEKYHEYLEINRIDQHELIGSIGRVLPESIASHPYLLELIRRAEKSTGFKYRIYLGKVEFRVVRPHCDDNNPLHRDHWFPYFVPLLNVYVPLSGSFYDSAMCIVPFSHKWTDEEVVPTFTYEESAKGKKHTKANGVAYSVPEVEWSQHAIRPHRPDIVAGDFMLFAPSMIHGGGDNSSRSTRFSLEIRLERVVV